MCCNNPEYSIVKKRSDCAPKIPQHRERAFGLTEKNRSLSLEFEAQNFSHPGPGHPKDTCYTVSYSTIN